MESLPVSCVAVVTTRVLDVPTVRVNTKQVVDVPEEEREKYDNYDSRLDVENAETYEKFEFLEACKSMGITQDL